MPKTLIQGIAILINLSFLQTSLAQGYFKDSSYIYWNKNYKLRVLDFLIKVDGKNSGYSSGQFGIEVDPLVGRFSFGVSKNYKSLIKNYFHRSSSWIDTSSNIESVLAYHQTLWNLWEVQVRKFRQKVDLNRKVIYKGLLTFKDLENEIRIEFSKWVIQFDTETEFGRNDEMMTIWKDKIQAMLNDLKEYAVEN